MDRRVYCHVGCSVYRHADCGKSPQRSLRKYDVRHIDVSSHSLRRHKVGICSAQVPVYVSEIAQPSKRGRLTGLTQWAISTYPDGIDANPSPSTFVHECMSQMLTLPYLASSLGHHDHVLLELWLFLPVWHEGIPNPVGTPDDSGHYLVHRYDILARVTPMDGTQRAMARM